MANWPIWTLLLKDGDKAGDLSSNNWWLIVVEVVLWKKEGVANYLMDLLEPIPEAYKSMI